MPDTEKYMNTMNLDREDVNKFGFKLGDICHIGGSWVIANRYNYCGYPEFDVPRGAKVRIIGICQTSLNAKIIGGIGDVYVDLELVDYENSFDIPIRLGNRHAGALAESHPHFAPCPDGSDWTGYLWPTHPHSGSRWSGMWTSMMGTSSEDGTYTFTPAKIIDPQQFV
jgi:hypothetical protein